MTGEQAAAQGTINPPVPLLMSVTVDQLCALGVSRSTVTRKLKAGEWKKCEPGVKTKSRNKREILVASLPADLQFKWLRLNVFNNNSEQTGLSSSDVSDDAFNAHEKEIRKALLRLPPKERVFWIKEALRLEQIVVRYGEIKPKRRLSPATGRCEFVPKVFELCEEAVCTDNKILSREPHRQATPSPFTLDGWWRTYKEVGLLTFLRRATPGINTQADKRLAVISPEAVKWVNENWQRFKSPRHLHKALDEIARRKKWKVPSESWFYRTWNEMPAVVAVQHLEGKKGYESKLAPYVPRNYSDLEALQVLSGDHSERDVTVLLPDGRTIARPWLTPWYDLRTGLLWGRHFDRVPSSHAAAMAYADGVLNFGAQPPSRPEQGVYSYLYTDHGRTYKSHNWDGKVIAVHENAMQPDSCFQMLLTQRHVGIIGELGHKHMLARGGNPKENPIEEVHNAISYWEENTFDEYCGRDAKSRPERWRELFAQHQQFLRGKRDSSPFIRFEDYVKAFDQFMVRFNSSEHMRITLGGIRIVPIDEYHRLYTTRYEIAPETLALLLMKAERKKIGKDGVTMFRPDWHYNNELMSEFKGMYVEVRYKDDDYSRVWVILPNKEICEAQLITPSSLINPNIHTLKTVAKARAYERELERNFEFIAQSKVRGETTEDRVARLIELEGAAGGESTGAPAVVQRRLQLDHESTKRVSTMNEITEDDVSAVEVDNSIFANPVSADVREFDGD